MHCGSATNYATHKKEYAASSQTLKKHTCSISNIEER